MINQTQHYFFIGIAGTGMSALAQYLKGIGKSVSGSDRFFKEGEYNEIREKLEALGIRCFTQNGEGIGDDVQCVIVSTAIEETVPEVQKTRQLQIPILKILKIQYFTSSTHDTHNTRHILHWDHVRR